MNAVLSTLSLAIASTAIVIAFMQSRRGAEIARDANEIPVVGDIFREFRSAEFRRHITAVRHLPAGSAEQGFAGLGDAADSAYAVCYFFEYLGHLVAYGDISEDVVLGTMSTQLLVIWQAMEPWVEGERQRRHRELSMTFGRRFLPHYEHLVARALRRRGPDGWVRVKGVTLHQLPAPLRTMMAPPAE